MPLEFAYTNYLNLGSLLKRFIKGKVVENSENSPGFHLGKPLLDWILSFLINYESNVVSECTSDLLILLVFIRNQRNRLKLDNISLPSPERHRPLRHLYSSDNMHVPPFNIPNLRIEQRKTSSAEDMARKNSTGMRYGNRHSHYTTYMSPGTTFPVALHTLQSTQLHAMNHTCWHRATGYTLKRLRMTAQVEH